MTFGGKVFFLPAEDASDRLAFLRCCQPHRHARPAELPGLSGLAAPPRPPPALPHLPLPPPLWVKAQPAVYFGIPGGVFCLPGGGGTQAAGRPNEVVSQRRIVIPPFGPPLPFWGPLICSCGPADPIRGWSGSMTSSAVRLLFLPTPDDPLGRKEPFLPPDSDEG